MQDKKDFNRSEDIFETFLVKEKELDYIEREHAQAAIIKMAKDLKAREKNSTIFTKIRDFFSDCKDSRTMLKMKKTAEKKMSLLSDEEKCDKEIDHKGFKHGFFKTHIFFEQKFTEKNIIADCGGIHFPVIEFEVYMRIELVPAEIWTQKHFYKRFNSYETAENYYLELRKKYKDIKSETIIRELTKKIDDHCDELNKRIKQFNIE